MPTTAPASTMPTETPSAAPSEIAARCRTIVDEVSSQLLERDTAIRVLMTAMLAGQHAFVLGPPGAAKSDLVRSLTCRIDGGKYFEIPMTKYTEPKQIFGPVDMEKLIQGEYVQQFDGNATQCHVAFVDEIFKGSASTLNSLLSFFNERTYKPETGGDLIDCPLISAITASNELPAGDECAALYDRLLVRIEVGYLKQRSNFINLITGLDSPAQRTTLDLADLQAAVYQHVPAVTLSEAIAATMWNLLENLNKLHGLVVSTRRWVAAKDLLKASAFLDGRDHVDITDLTILSHVLWHAPDQQQTIHRLVTQTIDPDAKDIFAISDRIEKLDGEYSQLKGDGASETDLSEWFLKNKSSFNEVKERLGRLTAKAMAAAGPTPLLNKVQAEFREVHGTILFETMGHNPYEGTA